jgi:hypothetical protein
VKWVKWVKWVKSSTAGAAGVQAGRGTTGPFGCTNSVSACLASWLSYRLKLKQPVLLQRPMGHGTGVFHQLDRTAS